jgi:hypothetical protein
MTSFYVEAIIVVETTKHTSTRYGKQLQVPVPAVLHFLHSLNSIIISIRYCRSSSCTIMNEEELNALGYPVLKPKTPVPSDIEVSQSIVREVGLLPIAEVGKQYVR